MVENEDWLMRPVIEGLISYTDLVKEGSPLDLEDIALMNEALDVRTENAYRARPKT